MIPPAPVAIPPIEHVAPTEMPEERHLEVAVLHGLAVMTTLRLGEAVIWPDPFFQPAQLGAHYREAFTGPPRWDAGTPAFTSDGDPWAFNALGHPLLGSEWHQRARRCGSTALEAAALTAGATLVWEYGIEANAKRPSGIDLIVTPLGGAVVGELRYRGLRAAGSVRRRGLRRALQWLLDPFGQLERSLGTAC